MGEAYDLLNWIYRTERIGYVSGRNKFCAFVQQSRELFDNELAVIIHRRDLQPCAFFFTQQLPGHDVRVMLHRGDQDFVASFYVGATVAAGNQIDRFGGSSGKDYLARL